MKSVSVESESAANELVLIKCVFNVLSVKPTNSPRQHLIKVEDFNLNNIASEGEANLVNFISLFVSNCLGASSISIVCTSGM